MNKLELDNYLSDKWEKIFKHKNLIKTKEKSAFVLDEDMEQEKIG